MRGVVLFPICLCSALVLHVLPFLTLNNEGSKAMDGGNGGSGQVTLAAASQQLAQQVSHWKRPPDVSQTHPEITVPEIQGLPQLAVPLESFEVSFQAPVLANPLPQLQAVPLSGVRPKLPPSPSPPPQFVTPEASPTTPEASPTRAAAARHEEQAAGKQLQTTKGDAGAEATTAGVSNREILNLKNRWGAAIIARIQRQKRPPSGGGQGTVRLNISVSTMGRLISVTVAQGSGQAAIDQAAVRAVRKARLPRSPKAISSGNYSFTFRMTFTD